MAFNSILSKLGGLDIAKGPSLPGELQLAIMEHLVAQQCPVIALENQAHLDQIISQLIDLSGVTDRASDNIAVLAEKAIFSTAAIRPSFRLGNSPGLGDTCISAGIPPGLSRFTHRIRHLELAFGMNLSAPAPPEPGYSTDGIQNMWLATQAMRDIQQTFPALDTFIVFLSVDTSGYPYQEAMDGNWWQLLKSVDTASFIDSSEIRTIGSPPPPMDPPKDVHTWVSELLNAADAHKVGKKRVFKLVVERDMKDYGMNFESLLPPGETMPLVLRSDEIIFTNESNTRSVIAKAWDSQREVEHPNQRQKSMLRNCAVPTLLIRTPYGSYAG